MPAHGCLVGRSQPLSQPINAPRLQPQMQGGLLHASGLSEDGDTARYGFQLEAAIYENAEAEVDIGKFPCILRAEKIRKAWCLGWSQRPATRSSPTRLCTNARILSTGFSGVVPRTRDRIHAKGTSQGFVRCFVWCGDDDTAAEGSGYRFGAGGRADLQVGERTRRDRFTWSRPSAR